MVNCKAKTAHTPTRSPTFPHTHTHPSSQCCLFVPILCNNRFFADMWMLFPKESEYMEWFTKAGFTDVKITRIGPSWYRGVRRHGLIMGCSVTGVKPQVGVLSSSEC